MRLDLWVGCPLSTDCQSDDSEVSAVFNIYLQNASDVYHIVIVVFEKFITILSGLVISALCTTWVTWTEMLVTQNVMLGILWGKFVNCNLEKSLETFSFYCRR